MKTKYFIPLKINVCRCFNLLYTNLIDIRSFSSLCNLKDQVLKKISLLPDLKKNDIIILVTKINSYKLHSLKTLTYSYYYRKQEKLELNISTISGADDIEKYIMFLLDEFINSDETLIKNFSANSKLKYINPITFYNLKVFDVIISCLKTLPELKNYNIILIPEYKKRNDIWSNNDV